jgi:hypothetical protein
MDSSANPDKAEFARLLNEAFQWLAEKGLLEKPNRHETSFAKICGTDLKNTRRWRDGEVMPQRDNWETAKIGLARARLDRSLLSALQDAWAGKKNETVPSRPLSISNDAHCYTSPYNPFPKICFINLDVPVQGSSSDDFIVMGELRFALAPDLIDREHVTVGVRRAVLLPDTKNCHVKVGSLFRPKVADAGPDRGGGAAQVIFLAEGQDPSAVLEGDQFKGEALGRFIATGDAAGNAPKIDVLVQIETANDLCVSLTSELPDRSISQKKMAEKWVALQMSRTIQEVDGSLRIAACSIKWERNS